MNSADEGLKELNGELKTLQHEFNEVKNKQQQRIIHSSSLQLNFTTTTNNLANEIQLLKNEFNSIQSKQREIISQDLNNRNLKIITNDLNIQSKFTVRPSNYMIPSRMFSVKSPELS